MPTTYSHPVVHVDGHHIEAVIGSDPSEIAPVREAVHDLAERAGFEALYLSGASIAYTRLGRSDIGLVTASEVEDVLAMVRAAELRAELVVVAVDALSDNPATAAVVRALDAAIVTVRMGVSPVAEVERVVALNDVTTHEALAFIDARLKKLGVSRALQRAGAVEGDVIHIGAFSFDYLPEL